MNRQFVSTVSSKPALVRPVSVLTANGKFTTARRLLIAASLPLALAACGGSGARTNIYTADAAQKVSLVERGEIISVRKVSVSGNNSQVGTMTGIGAGAIGGSAVGGDWRSNALGAIGGAVVGGVGGSAIDRVVNEETGYEYLFQTDGGKLQALTQVDSEPLAIGQRVLLIQGPPARLIIDTTGLPPKAAAETVTAPPPAPAPAAVPPAAFTITVTPVQPATVTTAPAPAAAPVPGTPAVPPASTSVSAEPIAPPASQPASVTPEPAVIEAAPLAPPPAAQPETPPEPAAAPAVVPPTEPTP